MRNHYEVLDVLRFVAAAGVLLFHLGHWLNLPWLLPNAGIAVDFFFCLSGFVMVIAYQHKVGSASDLLPFLRVRVLRLWPMIIVATFISAGYLLAKGFLSPEAPTASIVLEAVSLSLLSIPYISAPESLGGPQVFPLNGPQFSLFFELFVNIVWTAILITFPRRFYLAICTFLVLLSATRIPYGFGGDTTANFWFGFPRVTCSFFLGILAANIFMKDRSPSVLSQRVFVALLLLTALIVVLPIRLGLIATTWTIIVSPILVVLGAKQSLPSRLKATATFSGTLSYPIYTLHYPMFCWLNGIYVMTMKSQGGLLEAGILFPIILAICCLVTVKIELPVMARLRRTRMPSATSVSDNS
ncbi:acyltransferase family protein [Aliirhizobium smilacinae]|uniref:Acyltransferase n=1 Tax=Aliirhizobium smilacinae TaxID=1395944 RepID=A0A5C4XFU3_9HYPH|nr:acyltransferase [Rhizobium smilacinae]TNM62297.1 acyltransferase [Rhizobium smilacinae]